MAFTLKCKCYLRSSVNAIMFYQIYTLHLIGITTIIYIELVAMLLAMTSVAQLAVHHTRFTRLQVQFPAGWPNVAFFTTGHGWVLESI